MKIKSAIKLALSGAICLASCLLAQPTNAGTDDTGDYNMPDSTGDPGMYNPTKPTKMEKVANDDQVQNFLKLYNKKFYIFGEDRRHSIRRYDALPIHWLKSPGAYLNRFAGTAQPGEYYVFQLGVYSPSKKIDSISIDFSDLKNNQGKSLSAKSFTCFNLGGVDFQGRNFTQKVSLGKGRIQPMWIGVQIPKDAKGAFSGKISVTAKPLGTQTVALRLNVKGEVLTDKGDSNSWRMSRMHWLNSRLGHDDSQVVKPFKPIKLEGNSLAILGRKIILAPTGLPAEINSYFADTNTKISNQKTPVLAKPMQFIISTDKGNFKLTPSKIDFYKKNCITGSLVCKKFCRSNYFNSKRNARI